MGFKIKNFYGSQPASVASVAKVASPAKDIDSDGNDRPLTAAQQKAADNKKDGVIDLTTKKKPYVKKGGKATGNMKDYKIGSKERRAEYEARGWKQDDTTKVKKKKVEKVADITPEKKVTVEANVTTDATITPPASTNKTEVAKSNVDKAKDNIKDAKASAKDTRKSTRIQKRADRKNARAERIKKQGGTKVGNALRGVFKKKDKKNVETVAKYKTVAKKCACGKAKCDCK